MTPAVKYARLIVGATAVCFVSYSAFFLWIAIQHVLYPGFIDLEGDILQSIAHVARFEALYPPINANYIPLAYLPFYYIAAAPLYHLFGDSFLGPRLLSVAASLLSGAIIGWTAAHESGLRWLGFLAAGLFFASYRILDGFLTNVAPDPLLLFLVLSAQVLLSYGRTRFADTLGLILLVLAFWTKQQGALLAGWALLFRLTRQSDRRTQLVLALTFVVAGPVAYLILALNDPWFGFYTWSLPLSWDTSLFISARRTIFVLATFVPFGVLLTFEYARDYVRRTSLLRSAPLFFAATGFITAVYTMMTSGSSNNHYIVFIASLVITAALGAETVCRKGPSTFTLITTGLCTVLSAGVVLAAARSGYAHRAPMYAPFVLALAFAALLMVRFAIRRDVAGLTAAGLLVTGQLTVSAYDPRTYLPDRDFPASLANFQRMLANLDGPVAWPDMGYAPRALTGRPIVGMPSWVALGDIGRQAKRPDRSAQHIRQFQESLRTLRIDYLLTENRLRDDSPWKLTGDEYLLVRDFGQEFSAIHQIGYHWFTGGEFPRFLYRHVSPRRSDGQTPSTFVATDAVDLPVTK